MPNKTVIVGSAIGLHARPAAIIAEAVVNAGVPGRRRFGADDHDTGRRQRRTGDRRV